MVYLRCILIIVVVGFVLRSSAQSFLNLALSEYGTVCNSTSHTQLYECENVLNGDKNIRRFGWRSTKGQIFGESLQLDFPSVYNISAIGLQKEADVNTPYLLFVQIYTLFGTNTFNIVMQDDDNLQVFNFGILTNGSVAYVSDIAENVNGIALTIMGVHNLNLSGNTGLKAVEVYQKYKHVYTSEDLSSYCSFPFLHNGSEFYTCEDFGSRKKQCKTSNQTIKACLFPISHCPDDYSEILGPPNVKESWCQSQGGCYNDSECVCYKALHSCPPDWYGISCNDRCYCQNSDEGCDIYNGRNNLCVCLHGYTVHANKCLKNRKPSVYITNEKVNEGQMATLSCSAEGIPVVQSSDIHLTLQNEGLSFESIFSVVNNTVRTNVYNVNVSSEYNYRCTASNIVDTTHTTSVPEFYLLPALTEAPGALMAEKTLYVYWRAWREFDYGDPPVTHYDLFVKQDTNSQWIKTYSVNETGMSFYRHMLMLSDVQSNRTYSFYVVCVREGIGGEGNPSPNNSLTVPASEATVYYMYILWILVALLPIIFIIIVIMLRCYCVRNTPNEHRTAKKSIQKRTRRATSADQQSKKSIEERTRRATSADHQYEIHDYNKYRTGHLTHSENETYDRKKYINDSQSTSSSSFDVDTYITSCA